MSRKTELVYRKVFQYIDSNIITLKCNSFMTDYETAMRNVLKKVSPYAELFACWFHFAQACRRQASKNDNFIGKIQIMMNILSFHYFCIEEIQNEIKIKINYCS